MTTNPWPGVVAAWLDGDEHASTALADLFEEAGLDGQAAALRAKRRLYVVTWSEDYTLEEQVQAEVLMGGYSPEEAAASLVGEYEFASVRERKAFIDGLFEAPTSSSWSEDHDALVRELVAGWREAYPP